MSTSDEEDFVVTIASAITTLSAAYFYNHIVKIPCRDSALSGADWVMEILNGHEIRCQQLYQMEKHVFLKLSNILETKGLLRHTNGVRVEEQLGIFMYCVGHNQRNQVLQEHFQHSGETISRHFKNVFNVIVALSRDFFQPPGSSTPPEILDDNRFYLYFKDCVGAIDGTYIPAMVPCTEQVPFINRKGDLSQNVLVACSFDLQFTYVLAGWEGSATDSRVLSSVLTRTNKLHVPEGKYYVVDAGYANVPGFLAPYRGTRYHLKEFGVLQPENAKEIFNLRHSSLRNAVERIIGILKKCFPILTVAPPYPFETQVKLVMACCIIHNHIRRENINDLFSQWRGVEQNTETEPPVGSRRIEGLSRTRQRKMAGQFRKSIADAMWSDF